MRNELTRIYRDTLYEFKRAKESDIDVDYWQGRKDAMRLCLALILPDLENSMNDLLDISSNYRPTESELVQQLLETAVYNVATIVYEIEEMPRVDGRTVLNLKNFVKQYDYLAEKGKFKIIEDHCLS